MTLALLLGAAALWLAATRWRLARLRALASRAKAARDSALATQRVVGADLVAFLGSPRPSPDAADLADRHALLARGDSGPWLERLPGLAMSDLPRAAGPLLSPLLAAADEAEAQEATAAEADALLAQTARSTALDPLGAA